MSYAADAAPRDEIVDGDDSYLDGNAGDAWALPPRGADGLHVIVLRRSEPPSGDASYEARDDGRALFAALGAGRLAESASLLYAHPDVTLRRYDCRFASLPRQSGPASEAGLRRFAVGLEDDFVPTVVEEVWARLDAEFPSRSDAFATPVSSLAVEADALLAPCAGALYALRGEDRALRSALQLGAPRLLLVEHAAGGGGSCCLARCASAAARDDASGGLHLAACLATGAPRPRPAELLRRLCAALATSAGVCDPGGGWAPPATVPALQSALRGLCASLVARGAGGAVRVALLLDAAADVDDPRGLAWALVPIAAALPDWVQLIAALPDVAPPVPPQRVAPLVAAAHAAAQAVMAAAVPGAAPSGELAGLSAQALWAEAVPDAAAAPEDESATSAARSAALRAVVRAAQAAGGDAAAGTMRLSSLAPAQRIALATATAGERFAELPAAAIEAIADMADGGSPYHVRLSVEALLRSEALGGSTSGVVEAAHALPPTLRGALEAALVDAEARALAAAGCPAAVTAGILLSCALARQPLRLADLEGAAAEAAPGLPRDALPAVTAAALLAASSLLRRTEAGPSAAFAPRCAAAAAAICARYAPQPASRAAAFGRLARRFAPAALDGAGGTHAARHGVFYAMRAGAWGAVQRALAPDDGAALPFLEARLYLGDAGALLDEYDALLEAGDGASRLVIDALAGPAHDGAGGLRSRSPSPLPGGRTALLPVRSPSPERRIGNALDLMRAASPGPRSGGEARPCSPAADDPEAVLSLSGSMSRAGGAKVATPWANAAQLALAAVADAAAAGAAATAAVTRRSHAAAFAAALRTLPRRVAARRVAGLRSMRALLRAHAEELHARPWLLLQIAASAPARTPVAHAASSELARRAADAYLNASLPDAAPPGAKQLLLPRAPRAMPSPAVAFAAPRGALTCLAVSPCGGRVALAGDGGGICLCHVSTGEALATLHPHAPGAHALRLAWCEGALVTGGGPPSADILAAACADGAVAFTRVPRASAADAAMPLFGALAAADCVRIARGMHSPGGAACAACAGGLLATGGADGALRLWDPASVFGGVAGAVPLGDETGSSGFNCGLGALCALAVAPDGRGFAAAGWAGGAAVWRLAGGAAVSLRAAASRPPSELFRFVGHGGRVTALAFGPHTPPASSIGTSHTMGSTVPPLLASASEDGSAAVWCARSGRPLAWLRDARMTSPPLTALAFSPDARLVATADGAGGVRVWAVAEAALASAAASAGRRGAHMPPAQPAPLHGLRGLSSGVADVAFAAGGTRLAVALERGGAHLWARAGLRGGELDGGPGMPHVPPPPRPLGAQPPPPPPSLLPPPRPVLTEWEVSDASAGTADDVAHAAGVAALASRPAAAAARGDGDVALSVAADGTALLWRRGAARQALLPPPRPHGAPPPRWRCGALAPGARWAIAAGEAGAAAAWRLPARAHGIPLHDAPAPEAPPSRAFAAAPRGSGAVLAAAFCNSLAEHGDDEAPMLAATGGADGALRLWRLRADGDASLSIEEGPTLRDDDEHSGGRLCALAWGPRAAGAADVLASGGDGRTVALWSASVGVAAARLGHDGASIAARITALAWSDAAAVLALGCADGEAQLWDVRSPGNAAVARLPRRRASPWASHDEVDGDADEGVSAVAFCPVQPCWLAVARRCGGADVYDTRMLDAPHPLPLERAHPAAEAAAAEAGIVAHAPAAALAALSALTWHCHDGSARTTELWLGDAAGRVRRLAVTPYHAA